MIYIYIYHCPLPLWTWLIQLHTIGIIGIAMGDAVPCVRIALVGFGNVGQAGQRGMMNDEWIF